MYFQTSFKYYYAKFNKATKASRKRIKKTSQTQQLNKKNIKTKILFLFKNKNRRTKTEFMYPKNSFRLPYIIKMIESFPDTQRKLHHNINHVMNLERIEFNFSF